MNRFLIGVLILASALVACARQHEPRKDRAQASSESASTSARPTVAASAASLSPAIADLLVSLRSTNWTTRAETYRRLTEHQDALQSTIVKAALIELVDQENRAHYSGDPDLQRRPYGEYVESLIATVDMTIDWSDPRQLCILAHSPEKTDKVFAKRLAGVGLPLLPCLLDMADNGGERDGMVAAVALTQLRTDTPYLDPTTSLRIAAAMTSLLHDPDEAVRIWAIDAQDLLGTADMIPALRELAGNPDAAKAIREIQTALPDRLTQLQSDDLATRRNAFEHLRARADTLTRPDVQRALLDLLDLEWQLARAPNATGDRGEGWGEYVGEVGDVIYSFLNWSDPRQVCLVARQAYNPDSPLANDLASHGRAVMPCLVDILKGDDSGLRAEAIGVLIQALVTSTEPLSSQTVDNARQLIRQALRDPDDGVRLEAVIALGKFGGTDMIPGVAEVAAADRKHKANEVSTKRFALRALGEMQARARLKVTPTSPHPKISALLEQLQAPNWQARVMAFDWIRSDATNLTSLDVRRAVIELRDHERLIAQSSAQGSKRPVGIAEKDADAYKQYVADLDGAVDTFPETSARR